MCFTLLENTKIWCNIQVIKYPLLGQLDALNVDNDISSGDSYNDEFSISDDVVTYQYNLVPQGKFKLVFSGAATL